MASFVPDILVPNGNDFAVVDQQHIRGGMHSVASIADWQTLIEPRYRKAGLGIYDQSTKTLWALGVDLVTLHEIANTITSGEASAILQTAIEKLDEAIERLDDSASLAMALTRAHVEMQTRSVLDSEFFEDKLLESATLSAQLVLSHVEQAEDIVVVRNDIDDLEYRIEDNELLATQLASSHVEQATDIIVIRDDVADVDYRKVEKTIYETLLDRIQDLENRIAELETSG